MNRRELLAGAAAATSVALAGCTSSLLGTGSDNEPVYDPSQKDELLLSVSDFPDDWERDDALNEEFDAVFITEGGSTSVLLAVVISEEVGPAKETFDRLEAGAESPNDYPIADECVWYKRRTSARTAFRHSNAVGTVVASRIINGETAPDVARSQSYAGQMYAHWQEVIRD